MRLTLAISTSYRRCPAATRRADPEPHRLHERALVPEVWVPRRHGYLYRTLRVEVAQVVMPGGEQDGRGPAIERDAKPVGLQLRRDCREGYLGLRRRNANRE